MAEIDLETQRRQPTRFKITSERIDQKWQADLVDIQSQATSNRNYKFLLNVIDVLGKFAWSIPLKEKKAKTIVDAFRQIFTESGRYPAELQMEQESEFNNKQMKELAKEYLIELTFNRAGDKHAQGVIERFNKTIMTKVENYKTANDVNNFIDVLPAIVKGYNNTDHSTIKRTPNEALHFPPPPIRNENIPPAAFNVGDRVLRVLNTSLFAKGYEPTWSKKVYTIKGRDRQYYVLDIGQKFKENELIHVIHNETQEKERKQ